MKKNYRKVLSLILVFSCVFSMNLNVMADSSAGDANQDTAASVSAESSQAEESTDGNTSEDTAAAEAVDSEQTSDAETSEEVQPAEEVIPAEEVLSDSSETDMESDPDSVNQTESVSAEENQTADTEETPLLEAGSSYDVKSTDTLAELQKQVDSGNSLHFASGTYSYDGTLNIGAHDIVISTDKGAAASFVPEAGKDGIEVSQGGNITFSSNDKGNGTITIDGRNSTSGAVRGINCAGSFNISGGVLNVRNTTGYGIGGDAQGTDFNMTGGTLNIDHCGYNSDEGGFIWDNNECNFTAGELNITNCGYSEFGSFYVQCPVTFGSNSDGAAPMTVNLSNNASGTAELENTIFISQKTSETSDAVNSITVNKSATVNVTLTGTTGKRRGINTAGANIIIDGGKFIVNNTYTGNGDTYGIRGANVDVKNGGVLDVSGTKYGVAARGTDGTLTSEADTLITLSGTDSDSSETKNTITGGSVKMDDGSSVVKGVMTAAAKDLVDVQPVNASGELLTRFDLAAADGNKSISISADSSDSTKHPFYTYQVSQNHNGTEYVWAPAVSVTFWNSKSDIKADGTGSLGKDYTIRGKTLSYVDGSAPSAPAAPTGKTFSGWMISDGTTDSSLYDAAATAVTKNIDVYPQYTDSPVTPDNPDKWQVSKSKTASPTELSGDNKTTTVTLSLPSAEEELSSDVVFVMDDSSCINTVIKESMAELLQKLYSSIGSSKAKINVGIVMFRGNALTAYKLTEYKGQEDNSKILDAVKNGAAQLYSSTALHGSNIPSGLEAAKEMLQASSTPNNRKYMVLIGDGGTYLYMKDSDPTTCYSRTSGIGNNDGSIAEWNSKYGSATTYPLPSSFKNGGNKSDWDTFISSIQAVREQFTKYDQKYVRTDEKPTADLTVPTPPISDISTFITNVEESMYQTTSIFKEISESGVNCYAVYAPEKDTNGKEADMGVFKSFVQYLGSSLGKGTSTDFSDIEKEIVYLLNKGTVTDVIGSDFNLVMNGTDSPFTLTLAGTKLTSITTGTNEWSFGTPDADGVYPYVVTYTPESGTTNESFVWKINVPVENAKPLQLSYKLFLAASPSVKTAYDTNQSATLEYTSTSGSKGKEDFEIPVVNYTPMPTASSTTLSVISATTVSAATASSTTAGSSSTVTTTTSSSPKTGDDSPLIALMIALFASGFTILLLTDRKRSAGKRRKS